MNYELRMMNEEKNAPTVVGYTNSLLHKKILEFLHLVLNLCNLFTFLVTISVSL